MKGKYELMIAIIITICLSITIAVVILIVKSHFLPKFRFEMIDATDEKICAVVSSPTGLSIDCWEK